MCLGMSENPKLNELDANGELEVNGIEIVVIMY